MSRRVNWAYAAFAALCALAPSLLWLGRGHLPSISGLAFVAAPFVATAGFAAGLASWLTAPKAEAGPWARRRHVSRRTSLLTWPIFSAAIGPAILVEMAIASGGPLVAEGGSFPGYWLATFLISDRVPRRGVRAAVLSRSPAGSAGFMLPARPTA
jgi:hypothetical protein